MTNTYKLKSGKTISEDQTITAEELTVADAADADAADADAYYDALMDKMVKLIKEGK